MRCRLTVIALADARCAGGVGEPWKGANSSTVLVDHRHHPISYLIDGMGSS